MKNVYYDVCIRLLRCVRAPRGQAELAVTSMRRYDDKADAMRAYDLLTHTPLESSDGDFRYWLVERIAWLKQKLAAQREVGGPEYDSNPLLIGRTQGNIGALEDALRQFDARGRGRG